MVELLKLLLFKDICHINTTNQPFPVLLLLLYFYRIEDLF